MKVTGKNLFMMLLLIFAANITAICGLNQAYERNNQLYQAFDCRNILYFTDRMNLLNQLKC